MAETREKGSRAMYLTKLDPRLEEGRKILLVQRQQKWYLIFGERRRKHSGRVNLLR